MDCHGHSSCCFHRLFEAAPISHQRKSPLPLAFLQATNVDQHAAPSLSILRNHPDYDLLRTPLLSIHQGKPPAPPDFMNTNIIQGDGALEAGVRLLPLIMFMVFSSMVNGFLMPRYGLIPLWYVGGSSLALIGSALMCKTAQ